MSSNRRLVIVPIIWLALATSSAFAQDATPEAPTPETIPTTDMPMLVTTVEVAPTLPPPTPILPLPTVRAESTTSWMVGMPGEIVFVLDTTNSAPIYAIEAQCGLMPAASVNGVQVIAGGFAPDAVLINAGVQGDGTWVFAIAQPSAPLSSGILFRVATQATVSGLISVNCAMTGVGMDGARQALPFAPLTFAIAEAPTVPPTLTPLPSETPTLEATSEITLTPEATPDLATTAEVTPEVTLTPEVTPDLTPTLEAPETSEVFAPPVPGSIAGQVALSETAPIGVVVSLRSPDGTVVMLGSADDTGSFRFDAVGGGEYVVVAEAPGYLPLTLPITLSDGGGASLGTLLLFAGDVVASDPPVIDELDVVQFSAWYGDPALYDPRGDFNRDGQIDLLDLRVLAENLRRAG